MKVLDKTAQQVRVVIRLCTVYRMAILRIKWARQLHSLLWEELNWEIKQPLEVKVRVPEWVKPSEAQCAVAGKSAQPHPTMHAPPKLPGLQKVKLSPWSFRFPSEQKNGRSSSTTTSLFVATTWCG
jgi:hypothetical protein